MILRIVAGMATALVLLILAMPTALSGGDVSSPGNCYSFGAVSVLRVAQAEHTFSVANTSSTTEVMTALTPSCGCTSALVPGTASGQQLPITLAPGDHVRVRVTTNLRFLRPGPIDKFVYVMIQGQTAPAATLEMKGVLEPPVEFTPSALDFGSVPLGKTKAETIRVSFDPSLLASPGAPVLVSSDPDLRVTQVTDYTPVSATASTTSGHPVNGDEPGMAASPAITQTYLVTLLPRGPVGMIQQTLEWTVPVPAAHSVNLGGGIVTGSSPAQAPMTVTIPVTARITPPSRPSSGAV